MTTKHIKPYSSPLRSSRWFFWLVLTAIVLLGVNMRSPLVALGSVAPVLKTALHIGEAHIGWLGALPMLMFSLAALISPSLAKRLGLENTLVLALCILTLGLILRSVWVNWYGFLIGTLLLSLAIGFANTLSSPIIKKHAPQHIAYLTGVLSLTMSVTAGFAAATVYPLSLAIGWQWALGGWSILGIAAIIVWTVLRIKTKNAQALPQHTTHSQPNLNNTTLNNTTAKNSKTNTLSVWRTPLAWQLAVLMGLQSLLFYVAASFLPSIWVSKGLSEIQGGHMGFVFQIMAPATVICLTWLVRRGVSLQKISISLSSLNVLGVFGMAYLSSEYAWLWSALMGVGCAGIFTIVIILFSVRSYTPSQTSQLSGMAQSIAYLIAFLGPFGAGWLHEITQSWDLPLLLILIITTVNVVMAWLATRPIMIDGKPI